MRYMKMLTGSSVSDDALSTRNRICALVAVSGLGFSSCSARMALRPMGVAALSRPKALAAKFSVIRPRAGWPRGTSGINRANRGDSHLASASTMPAFSAMRRNPSHMVRVPNSSTTTSTDSLAMANRDSTMAANTCACPASSHWATAETAATMKKPNHRRFSMAVLKKAWMARQARAAGDQDTAALGPPCAVRRGSVAVLCWVSRGGNARGCGAGRYQ